MLKRWFLGRDATRGRAGYIWNSIAGFTNALQSTFILIFLQRMADEATSGVFTIAFASANLMLAIGKFGVRYYQVSDVKLRYTYGDYLFNRFFTAGLMILATLVFCAVSFFSGNYTGDKALFCLFLCLQKVVDAVEDAVHGEYQKEGCLDVAGRMFFTRLVCTVASFVIGFWLTDSLVFAALISLIVSVLVFLALVLLLRREFPLPRPESASKRAVFALILACLPLFASSFLSLFIVNAPKYAIDILLSEEIQAIYGFVSLPVFVVSLLAECLFRPMVTGFAERWLRGEIGAFCKRLWLVVGGIALLTVICVFGGVLLGVPVLGIVFNTDLKPYWLSVGVLLFGGGLLALTSFFTMILTVIERQKFIALAYIVAGVVSVPVSALFVKHFELLGAAIAYLTVIAVLCVTVIAFLTYFIFKRKGEKRHAEHSVV